MLTLIICLIVVTQIAAYFSRRHYRRAMREVERLKETGDLSGAADVYLRLLDREYLRRLRRCQRIAHLTNSAQPLLEYTNRAQDERRILETSMRLCLTHTRGRSWEKWQQRLALLDEAEKSASPSGETKKN